MVLAVTLHNLPEGMVVGLAAALAATGQPDAVSGALALSLGVGLQKYPGGSGRQPAPAPARKKPGRGVLGGVASGPGRTVGGGGGFGSGGMGGGSAPWLMSAAAGCMVCVTAQEMIPEAVQSDESAGVISIVLGFALMMALDVAL